MLPGVNPRQLKSMMRQMGISQDDLDATEVIIKTKDQVYIFENPSVQKVSMQGQISFQITGDYKVEAKSNILEKKHEVVISDEDIKMVSEQAGVSKLEARKALENSKGDIAEAIVTLSN